MAKNSQKRMALDMDNFSIPTKIFFGNDVLDHLSELDAKRVLIVTDPFIVKSGLLDMIVHPLENGKIDYTVFSDVVPDPPIKKIVLGVKALLDYKPEIVIALGGGSAIDSTKAIREFATTTEGYPRIPMIAIPTTSGTGSEVTSFAVITDSDKHVKYPLISPSLLPDEAILDAELVRTVPPAITADTGMDVFTHALEAFVSINENEFSSAFAEKAIQIVGNNLLRCFYDGDDMEARLKMHLASCLAGLAFNSAGLGLNHGMAHALGAHFHIPHGRANAMILPHVIQFNANISKHSKSQRSYPLIVSRYSRIAQNLGLTSYNEIMTVRSLANWVQFMCREMDVELSVSQWAKNTGKITEEEYFAAIPAMADEALADNCTKANPRKVTRANVIELYKKLWY